MDGIHDLGGKQGYGSVDRDEPPVAFPERWQAAVFAMMQSAFVSGATKNSDQFRHAIERIDPRAYLTHGYYGRWIGGFETMFVEAGVLSRREIDERVRERAPDFEGIVASRPNPNPDVVTYPPGGATAARPSDTAPRFAVGSPVRTLAHGVDGHTRLPAYARDKLGTIESLHGDWVFPDSNAHGLGENPQPLYTVAFTGEELWGSGAEPGLVVHLDLFESYLESA